MNSLSQILHTISYMGLPLLFAMVLHEYAHGWMAEKCGDSTAKREGRLTINPLAHIDPFGTVILPLICLILPGSFLLGWPSRFRLTLGICTSLGVTWHSWQQPVLG